VQQVLKHVSVHKGSSSHLIDTLL